MYNLESKMSRVWQVRLIIVIVGVVIIWALYYTGALGKSGSGTRVVANSEALLGSGGVDDTLVSIVVYSSIGVAIVAVVIVFARVFYYFDHYKFIGFTSNEKKFLEQLESQLRPEDIAVFSRVKNAFTAALNSWTTTRETRAELARLVRHETAKWVQTPHPGEQPMVTDAPLFFRELLEKRVPLWSRFAGGDATDVLAIQYNRRERGLPPLSAQFGLGP